MQLSRCAADGADCKRLARDKIRQQLQVLRDVGLIDFLGAGSYGFL